EDLRTGILGSSSLVVAEEEGFVLENRASHRSSELTPKALGQQPAVRIGNGLRKRISRLRQIVAPEHEGAAMELVGTRFWGSRYHLGLCLAEFRVEIRTGDFRLYHCIQVWNHEHVVVHEITYIVTVL